ncbi:MAG: C4-dicarboxylate ABC transporter [Treponema sp.]|jgi:hypothetical protein|nr:C4-dicarboxylate ABC transporter [Treponema sp.]
MIQGIVIIVVFFILAVLMIRRKIPTFVALLLMAIVTCVVSGVPFMGKDADGREIGWLQTIIEAGSIRMASAIVASIFGGWLGQLMNRTGVTETIIKKSAELGGDRPLVVSVILMAANAILFTTLSGLGSVIMVGSIFLPILISVGVPAVTASCLFLMSFNIGLTFNMTNWQTFRSIFGLELAQIQQFMTYMLVTTLALTIAFLLVEYFRNGRKFAFAAPIDGADPSRGGNPGEDTRPIKGVSGFLAMLSPVIPILLVVLFKVPINPAFIVGIIWILVFTAKSFGKAMNMLIKAAYDGIASIAPAVLLFIGIGILFLAVTNPLVKEILNPFMLVIVPSGRIAFIVFFALLAPLSLYRGPLNLFGLGSGIAALIIGLGTLNPLAVMGAFLSSERIQGAGDPTNTHNVWTANFTGIDVNLITKKTLPYLWAIAIIGVIITGAVYF